MINSRSIVRKEASNDGDVDASKAVKGGLKVKQEQVTFTQKTTEVKTERVQEKAKTTKN